MPTVLEKCMLMYGVSRFWQLGGRSWPDWSGKCTMMPEQQSFVLYIVVGSGSQKTAPGAVFKVRLHGSLATGKKKTAPGFQKEYTAGYTVTNVWCCPIRLCVKKASALENIFIVEINKNVELKVVNIFLLNIFLSTCFNIYKFVLDAKKNRSIETVHFRTHNKQFRWEIRKSIFNYTLLSGGL